MKTRSLRAYGCLLAIISALTGCGGGNSHGGGTTGSTGSGVNGFFRDPVPIGVKYDQPGFGIQKNGKFAGFDVDLARYVAQQLGFHQDTFVPITSDTERASGLGRNYRMVIATYTINEGRERGENGDPPVDFVGPYLLTKEGLLVKTGSKYAHKNPDLSKARVCTLPGSTPNSIPLPAGATPVTGVANYSDCVKDVESGAADVMLTDALIDYGYSADTKDYPGLTVEPTQYGQIYGYGIGVPHGDVAACRRLIPVVQNFLNSTSWAENFKIEFKNVVDQDPATWQQDYKPDSNSVPEHSYCQ